MRKPKTSKHPDQPCLCGRTMSWQRKQGYRCGCRNPRDPKTGARITVTKGDALTDLQRRAINSIPLYPAYEG